MRFLTSCFPPLRMISCASVSSLSFFIDCKMSKISISLKDSGDCSNIGVLIHTTKDTFSHKSNIKAEQNFKWSIILTIFIVLISETTFIKPDNSLVMNFTICQISFTLIILFYPDKNMRLK